MSRAIPLIALRTFVEVCKVGSMKRAADHLCVSPAAVSQQIKGLEDQIGRRLFERDAKGIQLTANGRTLFEELSDTFDVIEKAWSGASLKPLRQTRLAISTTSTIASAWLIPALGDFKERYPNIEISIQICNGLSDLKHGHVDISIQREMTSSPDNHATRLWSSYLIPVCSPKLLAKQRSIETPQDCLTFPLLQDTERNYWKVWMNAFGMGKRKIIQGSSYGDESLLISAACAGQGIALVNNVFACEALKSKRLVQVLDATSDLKFDYFVYCPKERREEWAIDAFMKWAVQQAGKSAHGHVRNGADMKVA
ncbi:LysR substrate-binding domain-containing protein [Pseudomonas huanghezhanensis]|uniref:LysR substrate-binding domain-containing protein n=1 Tax=Pseudomonas huanghezhanensis TaxID=3002903 RepID=UPI0022855C17|nr:LysR substrate-binding domain-containing protein [Pseudomonas sp. BSw22131]